MPAAADLETSPWLLGQACRTDSHLSFPTRPPPQDSRHLTALPEEILALLVMASVTHFGRSTSRRVWIGAADIIVYGFSITWCPPFVSNLDFHPASLLASLSKMGRKSQRRSYQIDRGVPRYVIRNSLTGQAR